MTAQLKRNQQGHTLVLTISNPEMRNAISHEIYASGMAFLRDASQNADIRSIIITGEGRHFCAGGNLQRLQDNRQQPPAVQAQSIDALHAWVEAIRACPKPVIAAVEGAAAGAGFSVALACDFLVASREAIFVMAYSNIALSPDGGGSWSLARALPRQLASELLMLGPQIGAERLHTLGVVNRVTESGAALTDALALGDQVNQRAPNALASIKALLTGADQHSLHEHLMQEQAHFVQNLHHTNAGEGITAFLDKRAARYP